MATAPTCDVHCLRAGRCTIVDGQLFFDSEEQAAAAWGVSPNGLALARQRGELEGAYVAVGRRVLYSRLAPVLRALGITGPEQLGAFANGIGITDVAGLIQFLTGPSGVGNRVATGADGG